MITSTIQFKEILDYVSVLCISFKACNRVNIYLKNISLREVKRKINVVVGRYLNSHTSNIHAKIQANISFTKQVLKLNSFFKLVMMTIFIQLKCSTVSEFTKNTSKQKLPYTVNGSKSIKLNL